jgi:bisphosphoglycerate-dependent phosphoglycerate mutase
MYGFNTDYNMYVNQQQQMYQQQYDYLSERSLSNHQYPMYGHNYMANPMMDQYGVMQGQYMQQQFDVSNNLQVNNDERNFEVSSEKSGNKPTTPESGGDVSPANDVQPLSHKQVRELIDTHQMKIHAGTNNGSRQLQKYLRRCSSDEVEEVLIGIQNELHDFVVNDYANYMLQSLISACNVEQRTRVVLKLSENLVELSRNKQGTHCLQALIAKVTTPREFKLICNNIERKFVEMCE